MRDLSAMRDAPKIHGVSFMNRATLSHRVANEEVSGWPRYWIGSLLDRVASSDEK